MKDDRAQLESIPGTTVFTAARARKGYHLNQFCMSLMTEEGRRKFREDPEACLAAWPLSQAQKNAVLQRDYNEMIRQGGNIYFLVKIGATDGLSVQKMVSSMTDLTQDEYAQMMLAGGRSPRTAEKAEEKREESTCLQQTRKAP
ncbi:MAG TPA: protocatechuate 4,5-dioxygenase subunit alpha [Parvularculaceae bacterium]|nr:protocatechuate 4,5-dioxygenase subunit alpha [Parvularculaceae bacterium]